MSNQPEVVVTLLDGTVRQFNTWEDYFNVYDYITLHSHNDQPAFIRYYSDGTIAYQSWYNQDKWHSYKDQPAYIKYYRDGTINYKAWCKENKYHRDNDKPAVIQYYQDGTVEFQEWYRDGKKITEQQVREELFI